MEVTMGNGVGVMRFVGLNEQEMLGVDGGGFLDALFVGLGTVASAWAVPVAFVCPVASVVMATVGSAAALVGCGVDVDLVEY